MITFIEAFSLSLFMSTWQFYDKLISPNTLYHNGSELNNTYDKNFGRILNERRIKNTDLKERIKTFLDEDDNTVAEKLNALVNDEEFRKQMNVFIREDFSQEGCNEFIPDKPSKEHFNILNRNNNLEKNPFLISPNTNHNNQDYSDPFKFCNNLEEFFDQLKIQKDREEEQFEELKHDQEYKKKRNTIKGKVDSNEKLTEELKGNVYYTTKPLHEVEYDSVFTLAHNEHLEESPDYYTNNRIVKPQYASVSSTIARKENSAHELDLLNSRNDISYCNSRYVCRRPRGHRQFLSSSQKYKSLIPSSPTSFGVFSGMAICSAFNPVSAFLFPVFSSLALVSFLGYFQKRSRNFLKSNKFSFRNIEYHRGYVKPIRYTH
ncbi:Plasmodium exported protein, unknown function [Plasmodium knowlesi strain H]|uniref:Pv-fam-d protein n=3 Tax=Plasmodium knowlesi TaxID=5850 RepID=A0A5E7X685_PLAKH|nr:Plasmodium exported protein, unknown function [Plasmodium knowlesi strain H]OTN63624.1 Uncharacterized protein PKNOH_S140218100 [Plasmodium knowlesi]CAA9990609.1 Plasmodium exported protein, unknown function [Plasmodium knowlesi strain H]SBO26062.1 Plasmodium exported protein, unknown function [Plasmodium knowlesi strain H]SBO28750.1 Plasmodium exported protein, unknown function [Plasmodium knowlesi strain H]VVS80083.1 Plasmodium exported protein, unknown function [Plasmodium knowlesi strai